MKPEFLTIIPGDVRQTLSQIPDESVHCVVTSPPYWKLRDYGHPDQIGQEPTVEQYIENLLVVFRQVWRVMRKDGVLWVNMGDCFSESGKGGNPRNSPHDKQASNQGSLCAATEKRGTGLKPKNLIGIPWRLAFALQGEGWYLRADIIWNKKNCMPESVTDRPTRSHEYIFLLTKSRRYFYDHHAIKEKAIWDIDGTGTQARKARQTEGNKSNPTEERAGIRAAGFKDAGKFDGKNGEKQHGHSRRHAGFNDRWDKMEKEEQTSGMRNKRDVWTVAPACYGGAHFATYPPDLIKPCILAGTSARGACSKCGSPYERVIEEGGADIEHQKASGSDSNGEYHGTATKEFDENKVQNASDVKARILAGMTLKKTVDWKQRCRCKESLVVPCVVLDVFAGTGTTAAVAMEFGRRAIACELNPKYINLLSRRCFFTPGLPIAL